MNVGGTMRSKATQKPESSVLSLRKYSEGLALFRFTTYREYLEDLYKFKKDADAAYSYSQFAEDLGFPAGNGLWLVITGRRKLSPMATKRIIEALQLKNEHRRFFLALVKHNNASRLGERERYLSDMLAIKREMLQEERDAGQDVLEYFSEWYYPIIRELVGLDHFQSDPQWIAQTLFTKILPKQAEHALALLERLELIRYDAERGRHVQTGGQVKLTGDLQAHAIVRYHEKMCDLAREAITRVPAKERDFNTLTLRLTEAKAKKVQALLLDLCKIMFEMESGENDADAAIYQINTQIFPLMKKGD